MGGSGILDVERSVLPAVCNSLVLLVAAAHHDHRWKGVHHVLDPCCPHSCEDALASDPSRNQDRD